MSKHRPQTLYLPCLPLCRALGLLCFVGCFVLGHHQGCQSFPHHQYYLSLQKLGLYSVLAAAPGLGEYKLPRVLCWGLSKITQLLKTQEFTSFWLCRLWLEFQALWQVKGHINQLARLVFKGQLTILSHCDVLWGSAHKDFVGGIISVQAAMIQPPHLQEPFYYCNRLSKPYNGILFMLHMVAITLKTYMKHVSTALVATSNTSPRLLWASQFLSLLLSSTGTL